MTRIIAGSAGGRRLSVPPGTTTRPTSDRAREGLFSTLGSLTELDGATVLDLYAGSGALGLEALSRGAAAATLVEDDPLALAAIQRNALSLELTPTVIDAEVSAFLAAAPETTYDVVVLDPPYELEVDEVLRALVPWLAEEAVVAVERRTRGGRPTWPDGLTAVRDRRYGEATLWYGRRS